MKYYFFIFLTIFFGCDSDSNENKNEVKKASNQPFSTNSNFKYCGTLKDGFMKTMMITFYVDLKDNDDQKKVFLIVPEIISDSIPEECYSSRCGFNGVEIKNSERELLLKVVESTGFKAPCP